MRWFGVQWFNQPELWPVPLSQTRLQTLPHTQYCLTLGGTLGVFTCSRLFIFIQSKKKKKKITSVKSPLDPGPDQSRKEGLSNQVKLNHGSVHIWCEKNLWTSNPNKNSQSMLSSKVVTGKREKWVVGAHRERRRPSSKIKYGLTTLKIKKGTGKKNAGTCHAEKFAGITTIWNKTNLIKCKTGKSTLVQTLVQPYRYERTLTLTYWTLNSMIMTSTNTNLNPHPNCWFTLREFAFCPHKEGKTPQWL